MRFNWRVFFNDLICRTHAMAEISQRWGRWQAMCVCVFGLWGLCIGIIVFIYWAHHTFYLCSKILFIMNVQQFEYGVTINFILINHLYVMLNSGVEVWALRFSFWPAVCSQRGFWVKSPLDADRWFCVCCVELLYMIISPKLINAEQICWIFSRTHFSELFIQILMWL